MATDSDTGQSDTNVMVILADADGRGDAGQFKVVGGSGIFSGFVDFHGFVFGNCRVIVELLINLGVSLLKNGIGIWSGWLILDMCGVRIRLEPL